MRAHNERLVLSLIRQAGALPKAEIARRTGLSAQTVSVIMRALEADGLLRKGEPVRGRVGQPSVPMGLAPEGAFFLGLNIGRRRSELVLVDFLGRVRQRAGQSHRYPRFDAVVGFANEAMGEFLGQLPRAQRARVAGLGIALPFRLWDWAPSGDPDAIELDAWRDRDIGEAIGRSWDFPVYLCNDASAACGAELVFGAQDKPADFLYFDVGHFVGGGLVLDNGLYTGRTGNAAALGSMPVTTADGGVRQLVDVASLATLEAMLLGAEREGDTIVDVAKGWHLPQEILDAWLDQAADSLAQAIVSCTCLIDFDTVVIDGAMPEDVRADLVRRAARQLRVATVPGVEIPEVREGTIGPESRSLGAASLPLSERFLVDYKAFLKG